MFLFSKEIEIKWSDLDKLGQVNHARYFTFLEHCRAHWFASLDTSIGSPKKTTSVVLVHVEIDYLQPIHYPATVLINMHADAPGRTSLVTHYEILDAQQPSTVYARSQAVLVWFDVQSQKSVPIPTQMRDVLSREFS